MSNKAMPSVVYDGLQAYVSAYACDPTTWGSVLYLSLLGYRASVRAIWAALLSGRTVEYGGSDALYLRRLAEVPYRTHAVALPDDGTTLMRCTRSVQRAKDVPSGLTHFIMLSVQATRFLTRGQPFYVLKETTDSDAQLWQRFVGLLDRAAGVPLEPQWAAELWRAGLDQEYGLIAPSEQAAGIEAWRVEADSDAWLALLKAGIQDGRLK